jgi:hypothetical protein
VQKYQRGENCGEVSLKTTYHILEGHKREKVLRGATGLNTVYNAYKQNIQIDEMKAMHVIQYNIV